MKSIKNILPYMLIMILDFYFLPRLITNTGSAMIFLLILLPLICFFCSFHYGYKYTFSIIFVLLTAVLFLPTIFLYYNESAWIYAAAYAALASAGMLIGSCFHKIKNKPNSK